MSHLRCALCGRLVALSSFDPSDYEQDIVVVKMASLGRGRGFKVVSQFSALGDQELMEVIAKRLRVLLRLIEGYSPKDHKAENASLDDQVEELDDEVKALASELEAAKGRARELEKESERHGELLSMVNEALELEYDEPFYELCSAVEALIEEYDDLLEEVEDDA